MDYGHHLLGLGVSRTLQERAQEIIFRIGKDGFTRGHLAGVECYNFNSAKSSVLADVLNKELIGEPGNSRKVLHTRDLFYNVHPQKLAQPGVGSFTLAVIGAAFEAKGLGGEEPLRAWVEHHKMDDVTFNTLKNREERENDPKIKAMKLKQQQKREAAERKKLDAAEAAKANRLLARAVTNKRRTVNG